MIYSNLEMFHDIMSETDLVTIESIMKKTYLSKLKEIFSDSNCELKFYTVNAGKSSELLKLNIPASIRKEYGLKEYYRGKNEEIIIEKVFYDLSGYDKKNITLNGLFEKWKAYREKEIEIHGISPKTVEKNFTAYSLDVYPTSLGSKKVIDIKYRDLEDFYLILKGKGKTSSRAKEIRTVLNYLFDFALREEILEVNTSRQFKGLNKIRFVCRKPKDLKTEKEREMLINYYLGLDTVYGYACALDECLNIRVSELKALKWSNINFNEGILHIRNYVNDMGEYRSMETKSKKEEGFRTIPISDRCKNILISIKNKNYGFKDEFIFLGKNNNFLLTQEINKNIKRACNACGINKNFSSHDTRRYAATQMAFKGASAASMQQQFGWTDSETAQYYINLANADIEAKEMLRNVLN
ncbi:MAG: tyrosine-type recombinase/integrase [Lachnospiraceae bacterium]|nr:tyrosine-type recombinase/integrase [Lachnospiraceae bacterium]